MSSLCPFSEGSRVKDKISGDKDEKGSDRHIAVSPKCPFGYDSQTFKLGPLSCVICQALLFETSKCLPCNHKFCRDCPLCGADIEKIELDNDLQEVVDRFIQGHARIKRSQINAETSETMTGGKVVYEDVSLERGTFLIQQAMRAFRAQNLKSAKSRLTLCEEDIREQLERLGDTSELCSQLGAVLGMLGDCSRTMGEADAAVKYYEESVEFLSKSPESDLEVMNTLSVSLNKIGDLKYYDGDLDVSRSYYSRSLNIRRAAASNHPNVPSQTIDVAVSLAKVADIDRTAGEENSAVDGFQEAIKCLESLKLNADDVHLEKRRLSVLEFLHQQLKENQDPQVSSA